MNWKRFGMAFVAVYLVNWLLNYLIHERWLASTYQALSEVWRPEAEMAGKAWIMGVTGLFFCFFFCFIFVRGYEGKGIGEGVRFGLVIGLFYSLPVAYDWYVVLPIPYDLALKWFLSGTVASVILGMVVAALYKPE